MKNQIIIRPIKEIDYYKALILSSGVHNLFLPMKFQFQKRGGEHIVREYFVNTDKFIRLDDFISREKIDIWDLADISVQLIEGIYESMYRYIFPFEYIVSRETIYLSKDKKLKLLFMPINSRIEQINDIKDLISSKVDFLIYEFSKHLDERDCNGLKTVKTILKEEKDIEGVIRKLNMFKKNIWRQEHGKISRTIAL
ncbi:MAG: hypothetical protein SPI74_02355 [Eubacterium sp.]|nr:hypothetical protein [Eubacterium sp.]